ncbi:MAG: hypothetical protein HYS61_05895 [Acidobacteria bacterium]|nr:hypothetical protein [Acidobacteriota bacterium]
MMRAIALFQVMVVALAFTSCGGTHFPVDSSSSSAGISGSIPFEVNLVRVAELDSAGQSAFSDIGSDPLNEGGVFVDNDDAEVVVELKGTQPDAEYDVVFCSFASAASNCLSVGSFTTSNSGDVQVSLRFPVEGTFTGAFLVQRNGLNQFVTGFPVPGNGMGDDELFAVHFQRVAVVEGELGPGFGPGGNDPLQRSRVEIEQNRAVEIDLKGAAENATYEVQFCRFGTGPAGCFLIGSFSTDLQGDGQSVLGFPIDGTFAGVVLLTREISGETVNQLVTGFPAP